MAKVHLQQKEQTTQNHQNIHIKNNNGVKQYRSMTPDAIAQRKIIERYRADQAEAARKQPNPIQRQLDKLIEGNSYYAELQAQKSQQPVQMVHYQQYPQHLQQPYLQQGQPFYQTHHQPPTRTSTTSVTASWGRPAAEWSHGFTVSPEGIAAQTGIGVSVGPQVQIEHRTQGRYHDAAFQTGGHLGGEGTANVHGSLNHRGASMGVDASAFVGVNGSMSGHMLVGSGQTKGGGVVTVDGWAGAKAEGSASAGISRDGVRLRAGGQAGVGAAAKGDAAAVLKHQGNQVLSVGGYLEGHLGAHIGSHLSVDVSRNRLALDIGGGGTLGIGGETGFRVEVNPVAVAKMVKDTIQKVRRKDQQQPTSYYPAVNSGTLFLYLDYGNGIFVPVAVSPEAVSSMVMYTASQSPEIQSLRHRAADRLRGLRHRTADKVRGLMH